MTEKGGRSSNGRGGDNLMVRTEELAQVLERWIEEHDAQHPRQADLGFKVKEKRGEVVGAFSARAYLRHYSGRSEKSVWTILNRRTEYTSLTIADALLSAIESPALLDGTLWVGRDPREVAKAANLARRGQGGQWMSKGSQLTEAG